MNIFLTIVQVSMIAIQEELHWVSQQNLMEKGFKSCGTSVDDYFWPQEREQSKLGLKIENKSNILKALALCVSLC